MFHVAARTSRLLTPAPRWYPFAPCRGKKKKAHKSNSPPTDLDPQVASLINLTSFEANMQKAVDALRARYARMRASGASPGILDDIRVDAYGASTALNKLAQVSVRDGRTLLVTVFDEGTSNAVERAIRAAGLNLNPIYDGPSNLKVPIPKPTEKARQGFAKVALQDAESAKVATRMVRRKAMDAVKDLKDDVGKEDLRRMENSVQQMASKYIAVINKSLEEKIKSINTP